MWQPNQASGMVNSHPVAQVGLKGRMNTAILGMRVPLLDLSRIISRWRKFSQHSRGPRNPKFILGPKVEAFERIAKYRRDPYAIGVSSGTDALLIVDGARDRPGDAVITTPTVSLARRARRACRRVPVFVDIEPDDLQSFNQRAQQFLESNVTNATERRVDETTGQNIRAIMPVHLFGLCCDMNEIWRRQNNIGST